MTRSLTWLLATCMVQAASAAVPADFPLVRADNLDACVDALERQGGGWCEIRDSDAHPSISGVWPENLDKRTRMVVGPRAILGAWNGAALDLDSLLFYFMGGGHADYGGNEVYEFDLKTGNWSRLTDPSSLTFLALVSEKNGGRYCWIPDVRKVPASTHTYDGVQFIQKTQTVFLAVMGAANGSCFNDNSGKYRSDDRVIAGASMGHGVYEFNPSRTESRNGLPPLTWRRLPAEVKVSYPNTVELPDGHLGVGRRTELFVLDPTNGRVGKRLFRIADWGVGTTAYHPSGALLSLRREVLLVHDLKNPSKNRSFPASGFHGYSLAVRKDGTVFAWNGIDKVSTFRLDAAAPRWTLYNWAGSGPSLGIGRVYSKWQYIPESDVFVGLSDHRTGVWVYRHPEALESMALSPVNPQALIDKAKAGSTVVVPPGTYPRGLLVNKSLTLKLKDARLLGVAKGKGIVNVDCDGCTVTIEEFTADGRQANCLTGNCAGIKAEGVKFDLTVRRARIDNSVIGILTDNRGGTLTIEDSLIENTGLRDQTTTIAHGLYAGRINRLTVRNSTIRNVNGQGHMLKSRAAVTTLENVRLLGLAGHHSRSVDLPCGGTLTVDGSLIQHGENADNWDLIAVGTEPRSCKEIRPSTVTVRDSIFLIDRGRASRSQAGTSAPNYLFTWRAPLAGIDLMGNRFVNLRHWSTRNTETGDVDLGDLSRGNRLCDTAAACDVDRGNLGAPSRR